MKLFGGPTIAQMREKMLYQAQSELLQAESMKEAYDAQVQMLRARVARLNSNDPLVTELISGDYDREWLARQIKEQIDG